MKQNLTNLIVFLLGVVWSIGHAAPAVGAIPEQTPPSEKPSGVQFKRLALVGGSALTLRYLGYKYFEATWYDGPKTDSIRWGYDWAGETYLHLDKGGHLMGGVVMAEAMKEAMMWCGFTPRPAALLGSLISWAALFEIEMNDAYHADWGFSVPDFIANTIGASVPLFHTFFPRTQAMRFKFSYYPSALYLDRQERRQAARPHVNHLIDDYEGMTFWMTLALNDLLPARPAEVWPDFLGLAIGYGATGLHGSNVKSIGPNKYYKDLPGARPEIFLSLDYDTRYLPGEGQVWSYIKEKLNWIHFPAPTVRVYPSWRFYLLYM
jgi:hypothetical protein